jgi:KDO2-lipid IV(A) lauroyltransferase
MNAISAMASVSVLDKSTTPAALTQAVLSVCQQLLKFDVKVKDFTIHDFTDEANPISFSDVGAQQLKLSDRARKLVQRHLWSGLWVNFENNASTTNELVTNELVANELVANELVTNELGTNELTISVTVTAQPMTLDVSTVGRLIYRLMPYRRGVIVDNIKRAYGKRISDNQVERLAQAHYTHLAKLLGELISFRFISLEAQAKRVRVEGVPDLTQAFFAEKGIIVLTGHFGNFEVSTVSGIEHFPQVKGRIHFLRRPIKPKWLSDFLTKRFNQAGFGVIGRRGSLDEIVTILEKGDAIVFPFDQYARRPEGIEAPFFDVPAGTHKSMAVIAMATGSPVMPAASWREPDGTHVLKFWPPLIPIEHNDVGQEIRLNTAQYNKALEKLVLAHPEQWWWVHRRWKNQRPVISS